MDHDRHLLCVPQVEEDVVSVFLLFAEARCHGFFWYSFAESSFLLLYETLREPFRMATKDSA